MPETADSSPKPGVATLAREAFAAWIDTSPEGRVFGQVIIHSTDAGYSITHVEDVNRDDLRTGTSPLEAREIARFTESGDYRPLKSAPNLRRGWRLDLPDARALVAALGYLYPAGVVHWYQHREGRLEVTDFRRNASRQSGMYERIKHLTDDGGQLAAAACCEDAVCLKKTLWNIDDGVPLGSKRGEGEIPCPEPCSVFVSFARGVRSFEKEEAYRDGLTPSEKQDMAALLEAAATGDVGYVREAEFDKPLNIRRLRYRNLTLGENLRKSGEEG